MGIIITILTVLGFYFLIFMFMGLFSWLRQRKRKKATKEKDGSKQATRKIDMLVAMLESLQCDYEKNESEGTISFFYQGEHLFAYNLTTGNPYIVIADPWWYESPLDDIENLALLRRAVNECNFVSVATLLYSINHESRTVGLHTNITLLWIRQIPDARNYLKTMLNELLRCHHLFFSKMEELRRLDHKHDEHQ